MRSIETKGAQEKKKKRNQIIVGVILVAVMLFSVLGYGFSTQDPSQDTTSTTHTYNGYEFVLAQGNVWSLGIGNFNFFFSYLPDEITEVNATGLALLNNYANKPLYMHIPNVSAQAEILRNLDQVVLRRQNACLGESIAGVDMSECDGALPLKTCEDNFIIFAEAQEATIEQYENCVIIYTSEEKTIQSADEFLYNIMGIK